MYWPTISEQGNTFLSKAPEVRSPMYTFTDREGRIMAYPCQLYNKVDFTMTI